MLLVQPSTFSDSSMAAVRCVPPTVRKEHVPAVRCSLALHASGMLAGSRPEKTSALYLGGQRRGVPSAAVEAARSSTRGSG